MPLQIAIDGPVASGKSTVARELALRLGCTFLDTGALYRAVAVAALQRGIAPEDERIARLKQLGELKQHGVLSEQEFAAEKARILG